MNFKINESAQKLRGGYYTPADLASFLAAWVGECAPAALLEPSCGDGALLVATQGHLPCESSITAFEINSTEAGIARSRAASSGIKAEIFEHDFLGWANRRLRKGEQLFDAVIGNPPFIRYQYLPEQFQVEAERVFEQLRLPFTRHTNAWVPFALASLALLRDGGRLAMIVPAEIIHIMHAESLRQYLGRQCSRLVIVDPQELWFEGTLQGAVILLAEKKRHDQHRDGVAIVPVRGRAFLNERASTIFRNANPINGPTLEGKWTRALLDSRTRSLLDKLVQHRHVHRFRDVAQVDVGIVTGANKFFLVTDDVVHGFELQEYAHPMFGRSEHCPGVVYDERQHADNVSKGFPTNFLWFPTERSQLTSGAREYIATGEGESLNARYKCRIRTPWYTVPSVRTSPVSMLKRAHDTPRLVLNELGAYTTDTAYRITPTGVDARDLVSSFLNPLTSLSAELEGRHYGGGVLELVPSEIERLLIPLRRNAPDDLSRLDMAVRTQTMAEVLASHGKNVLESVGVAEPDVELLLGAWSRLRDRRHRI